GTGSFGSAPVSGFGSIFVGGVEFDDSRAAVFDDDGVALRAGGTPMRLGMITEVEGGAVSAGPAGPTAVASAVHIARLAVGPAANVDIAGHTLTVLGQTLQVNGSTVFDPALHGGLAGLHAGDMVSVHALADAAGRPVATRIEPAASGEAWRLRGFVSATNAQAKRFTIGTATLDYGTASNIPTDLADQQFVQVRLAGAGAGGVLQVSSFLPASAAPPDSASVVTEGVVAALNPGAAFRIGALAVDITGAVVLPGPVALVAGAQAQVEGRLQAGMLVADKVTVLTTQAADQRSYQLAGTVSALNAANLTFVVRNVGVDYSTAHFSNGSAVTLADPNVSVHLQGSLSADGTMVQAKQISFP
ncbi:MAG TPA: DUF5666 domain-containing protein, partial [Burkholderiaceae bacterium]|nr:DUF5666 domain-containing protein [Burkholderiaceae bacterium]